MHDRSGKLFSNGDKVTVEGTIIQSYPGSDACEIQVQWTVPMHENTPDAIWLNSKQVDKIE